MLACIHGASKHGRYLSLATTSIPLLSFLKLQCALYGLGRRRSFCMSMCAMTLCCCADMHLLIPLLYPCYCVMPLALPAVRCL